MMHRRFQGGKLQGVRKKLGYIKNLGAGALWITPVLQNPQWQDSVYHGYGFQNLLNVDPRFGTEQDLIELVDEAHAHGLYVILDVVVNHTGDVFEYPATGRKRRSRLFPTLSSGAVPTGRPSRSGRSHPGTCRTTSS